MEMELRKLLENTIGNRWPYGETAPTDQAVADFVDGVRRLALDPMFEDKIYKARSFVWDLAISPLLMCASSKSECSPSALSLASILTEHCVKMPGYFRQAGVYERAISIVRSGENWTASRSRFLLQLADAQTKDKQENEGR